MNCTHQIKKNDVGNTCSMNEGGVRIGFCWGNLRERNDLEDMWNALVKAVMDLPVP